MRQAKQILVDGETYTVSPYSPTFGFKLLTKIIKAIGKPAAGLISSVISQKGKSISDIDIDGPEVMNALTDLTDSLDPDHLDSLIKEILSQTFLGQSSTSVVSVFESHFVGRYLHVLKLVVATVGAQYDDFLGVLGGLAKAPPVVKAQ